MSSLGPGSIIAGRYQLKDLLGRGAMGEVWRAEHTSLGTPVAIKLIDLELLGSESNKNELVQRFFREAKAAAALRSPHVVQIHDHGYEGPLPYIAMELLEGETLEQRLERERVLPPAYVAEMITHVARAMLKAHEAGIIHRDLKPSNVFLVKNDDEEVGKVLDFGIAKATHNGVLGSSGGLSTRTGSVVGTPCYMSPEQALGNKTIDHRADLWALGVIAYECLCGQRPFDSDALGDLIVQICARPLPQPSTKAAVPDGFDAWFARACARDPNERFPNAKELAEALRWVLAPDTTAIRRMSSLPSITAPVPRASQSSQPDISALAKTDPTTMTNRGLVSAVATLRMPPKRVRLGLVAGVAAAALLAGGTTIIMLSRKTAPSQVDPAAQSSPPVPSTPPAPPEPAPSAERATSPAPSAAPTEESVAPPEPTAQPVTTSTAPKYTTKAGTGGTSNTGTTKTKSGSTTTTKATKKDQLGF